MIKIFERFAPRWRNAVSRYAHRIWNDDIDDDADERYDNQAILFSREYRHALEKHYAQKGMRVYRGTLDGYIYDWLRKQEALKDTLKVIADKKKDKLVQREMDKLKETKDAQKMIDKLYDAKENETVYKVFSFEENMNDIAAQHGDENAYALGTGINELIIGEYSSKYFWRTQKDRRVRNTHEQLADKVFMFNDPPTTVDKAGRRHTGNPGTDWGCRCFADIAPEKEKHRSRYIVYENEYEK